MDETMTYRQWVEQYGEPGPYPLPLRIIDVEPHAFAPLGLLDRLPRKLARCRHCWLPRRDHPTAVATPRRFET